MNEWMYVCMYVCVCLSACVRERERECVCVYVCMYVCWQLSLQLPASIRTHTETHTHTNTHTHKHTHTHTHTGATGRVHLETGSYGNRDTPDYNAGSLAPGPSGIQIDKCHSYCLFSTSLIYFNFFDLVCSRTLKESWLQQLFVLVHTHTHTHIHTHTHMYLYCVVLCSICTNATTIVCFISKAVL